jgi:hypothetical protein
MAHEPFAFLSHEEFSSLPLSEKMFYIRHALDVLHAMQREPGQDESRRVIFLDNEHFSQLSQDEKAAYIQRAWDALLARRAEILRSILQKGRT